MWQVRGRREEIWLGLGRLVSVKTRERSMAKITQGLTTYVLSHTDWAGPCDLVCLGQWNGSQGMKMAFILGLALSLGASGIGPPYEDVQTN